MRWLAFLTLMFTCGVLLAQEEAAEQAASEAQTSVESSQTTTTSPSSQQQSGPATGLTLQEAFEREYAFLEAQRRQLEQRLSDTRSRQGSQRQQVQSSIDQLQNSVVRLNSRVNELQQEVDESEEEAASRAENRNLLLSTFQQAGVTLSGYGNKRLEQDDFSKLEDDVQLAITYAEGLDTLNQLSSIRTEQGTFYQPDGTELQGDIMRVGNIAAYGRTSEVAGLLAPAGAGRFKLWPEEHGEAVRALFQNQNPEPLPVFLFENLTNEIQYKTGKTVLQTINDGGAIGWIIVVLGLIAVVLIILRAIFLQRASADTEKLATRVGDLVSQGKTEQALEVCHRSNSAPARVVAAAVRNRDRDREHIEDIVSEAILHESSNLNRFGNIIVVIAAVSPLLGLLGTVTGMISTFDVITEFGTGDPKLLSGGIAVALITTQLGLCVAIPTLLVGNLLNGWAERIKDSMEQAALRVINIARDERAEQVQAA